MVDRDATRQVARVRPARPGATYPGVRGGCRYVTPGHPRRVGR